LAVDPLFEEASILLKICCSAGQEDGEMLLEEFDGARERIFDRANIGVP
jgi:hypothetical protein